MPHDRDAPRSGRSRAPVGAAPGTFRIDPSAPRSEVHIIAYSPDGLVERDVRDLSILPDLLSRWPVVWINVCGLGDADILERIRALLSLHPLALADVVNVSQRSKVEDYGDHLFIVARTVALADRLHSEQVSLFLGRGFVLTFQEQFSDALEAIRQRIRDGRERLRTSGPDYLAYAVLDTVIDAYYPVLETFGERLDTVEDEVIARPVPETLVHIRGDKRDLLTLRRALWPHREMFNSLLRDPFRQISDDTRVYLRDCYDHVIQLMDIVDTHREMAASLQDVYLSSVSNRMSEVMKVLTVVATIFIPLTFITGIYGMNFDPATSPWNMPELRWHWGYPAVLVLMAVIAAVMLGFFVARGWLRRFFTSPRR